MADPMSKLVPHLIAVPDLPSIKPDLMEALLATIKDYEPGVALLHLMTCAGVVFEYAVRGPKPAGKLEAKLLASLFELAMRRARALIEKAGTPKRAA
jgi:hypothetical protein